MTATHQHTWQIASPEPLQGGVATAQCVCGSAREFLTAFPESDPYRNGNGRTLKRQCDKCGERKKLTLSNFRRLFGIGYDSTCRECQG